MYIILVLGFCPFVTRTSSGFLLKCFAFLFTFCFHVYFSTSHESRSKIIIKKILKRERGKLGQEMFSDAFMKRSILSFTASREHDAMMNSQ